MMLYRIGRKILWKHQIGLARSLTNQTAIWEDGLKAKVVEMAIENGQWTGLGCWN